MSGWVLVTGAAKRIGREIALELARGGYDIIVHYHTSQREAAQTVKDIQALGRKACLVELDLADLPLVKKLIPKLTAEFGTLAALVNNASLFLPDRLDIKNLQKKINVEAPKILSESFYQHNRCDSSPLEGEVGWGVRSANTKSGFYGENPPSNSPLKGGRIPAALISPAIINILDADPPEKNFSFHNQSKKTLADLTRRHALRFAPHMRVGGVALGPVLPSPRQSPEHFRRLVQKTPLKKPVSPMDVARAVRFLIENTSMTGSIIAVDAGAHLVV